MLQDLRYALRALAKAPGFTVVVVLTLVLGVGATTAVFSVIDAALLRPLPFADPERLVDLKNVPGPPIAGSPKIGLDVTDWASRKDLFEDVTSYGTGGLNLTTPSGPVRVQVAQVMANFFPTLGVRPVIGRTFVVDEAQPGRGAVVVLSDGFWRRAFGADSSILGRTIPIDDRSFTVIGVMPHGFTFPLRTDLWVPQPVPDNLANWDMFRMRVVHTALARLAPGTTVARAQAGISAIETAFQHGHDLPDWQRWPPIVVRPLAQSMVQDAQLSLILLFSAVCLILLIACANAASLLLVRAAARQHEIVMRTLLGATRSRIVRLLLTEAALLSVAGGAGGLLLASWVMGSLTVLLPTGVIDVAPVTLDARVLGFTIGTMVLATLLFGLLPALHLARKEYRQPLSAVAPSSAQAVRTRGTLVALELGMALTLLIGAGLLLRSLYALAHVDRGFRGENVVTATVSLPRARYERGGNSAVYFRSTLERVRAMPGVEAASAVSILPLFEGISVSLPFQIVGRPPVAMGENPPPSAERLVIAPQYFQVLGISLLEGRDFLETDVTGSRPVVIINQSMARTFWPDSSPLGAQIKAEPDSTVRTVVGVVADVRDAQLKYSAGLQVYLPYQQAKPTYMTIAVRSRLPLASAVGAMRHAALESDPTVPLYSVRTMDEVVTASIGPQRNTSLLIGIAGTLALVLAGIGVYGVIAYSVARRTQEIGIRMALGAARRDVLSLVLRQGMTLTVAGVAGGLAASWALTRVMAHLLYQVSTTDAAVFAIASLTLVTVGLVATFLPARRAASVDPMVALGYE